MKMFLHRSGPILAALFLAAWCAGCSQHYLITLNNSDTITAFGRPRLTNDGVYVYKDAKGVLRQVKATRVRQIEAE